MLEVRLSQQFYLLLVQFFNDDEIIKAKQLLYDICSTSLGTKFVDTA